MLNADLIRRLVVNTQFFLCAFTQSILERVESTGYVQLEKYYRHYSTKERMELLSSIENEQIQYLLKRSLPNEQDFIQVLEELNKISISDTEFSRCTQECGKAIISWLFYCCKQKYHKTIRTALATNFCKINKNYIFVDEKYIIHKDIDYHIIEDIQTFVEIILNLESNKNLFFRGQGSLNYWLQPSISRDSRIKQNELKLYQELMLRCPSDFEGCKTHLDFLVEMQHYGLPTRLVDITTNPFVALFFAVCNKDDADDGEVVIFDVPEKKMKYEGSDTVTILSCLPLFSFVDQNLLFENARSLDQKTFNNQEVVARLLQEIRIDKPAFSDRIIPSDLTECLVVTPSKKNKRIIKQSGAFIICGLTENYQRSNPLEKFRYKNKNNKKMLLIIKNKKNILKQLRAFDIHTATLFPEIDDVANYLRTEWID